MNRAQVQIDWEFSRREARKKFGYKKNDFRRSKTWSQHKKGRAEIDRSHCRRCLQDNQTAPDSDGDGFGAARGVELVKDGGDVELDGVL